MKTILKNHLFTLIVCLLWASQTAQAQRFPAKQWQQYTQPAQAGFSASKLAEAKKMYEASNAAAFMVIYDGAVLAAWGDVERRYMCHSTRKSFMSAMYGTYVKDKKIDLNKTLAQLKIDDKDKLTTEEKKARIIDLLKARSGVYHPAAYEAPTMRQDRPKRGSAKAGEKWYYNNWDFNVLLTIIEKESGKKFPKDFDQRIARKIGMQDYRPHDINYHIEAQYSQHAAYPFKLSARDMARFGLLYLRNGNWQGQQIVSPNWVKQSSTNHVKPEDMRIYKSMGGYGYLWWIYDQLHKQNTMYSAAGAGGHFISIIPKEKLVIVQRVDTYNRQRVGFGKYVKLINAIIDSKTGTPAAKPALEPLPPIKRNYQEITLASSAQKKYLGKYEAPQFGGNIQVKQISKRMVLKTLFGNFDLLALKGGNFMIADFELPLSFVQDAKGNPHASLEQSENGGVAQVILHY